MFRDENVESKMINLGLSKLKTGHSQYFSMIFRPLATKQTRFKQLIKYANRYFLIYESSLF